MDLEKTLVDSRQLLLDFTAEGQSEGAGGPLSVSSGRIKSAPQVLALGLLLLLEQSLRTDSDQELLEAYNTLKPILERLVRYGR